MNEINYGEVFGVETSGGENESAPAEQTTPEADTTGDSAGENEAEVAEQPAEEKQQSAEENARYAAARRKAEQERDAAIAQTRRAQETAVRQAVEAERNRAQEEWNRFFATAQLKNTLTGQPITNREEFDRWAADFADAKLQKDLKDGKLTREGLRQMISQTPEVQNLRRAQEAAQRQQAAARQQQQRLVLDEQITEINKIDPSVKTVSDLMQRPEYRQIYANVQKGLSIVDAFKLANYDSLTQANAAKARQAALNAANSKEHMAPTQTRGAGAVTVPKDVKEMYRLYNPEATDAEIQAHYNRYHKN